jgi:RNA polymerase sigma factor (sigma-70 family)
MRTLHSDTDAALLRHVADRETSVEEARAAKAVFYERHVRYLFAVMSRKKGLLLSMAGLSAEDLVQETFMRAFERAHTFRGPPEPVDAEHATARTRAWLGRIATHLLADHMNRLREVSATPYLETMRVEAADDEPSPEAPSVALMSEGLESLSEREREVLTITALYGRAGEKQGRLPNAVSQDLATRLGTTNDNIRAIRVRAMKKLKSFLSSRGLMTGGGA